MDAMTIGRRLQGARLAAGMSQAEVAQHLGVPRPAISLMESGQRSVSTVELAKLAHLYGERIDALVADSRTDGMVEFFRAVAPVDAEDRTILDEAIDYCRSYARLEEAAFGEQRYEVPTYRLPRGRAIDQGEWLADQERRRLGLGTRPIASLVHLLEHQGIKILLRTFRAESFAGCYFYATGLGPCVVINIHDVPSRQRFSLAHEYAHVLLERGEHPGEVCTPTRKREFPEMRANTFAAAFLLPAAGIQSFMDDSDVALGCVGPEHVISLMHHFGVSSQAALWRLLNLGWIDRAQREQLGGVEIAALSSVLGYRQREPGAGEPQPDRFRAVAIEAWRTGQIATGELARLLNVREEELRGLLRRGAGTQARTSRAPAVEPDWL